jgi:hypothetical protein
MHQAKAVTWSSASPNSWPWLSLRPRARFSARKLVGPRHHYVQRGGPPGQSGGKDRDARVMTSSDRRRGRLLLSVLKRRQHFKPILCATRQYDLVVGKFEAVVTNNNHARAHAKETTNR